MIFDSDPCVVADPGGAERAVWDGVAPDSLGML